VSGIWPPADHRGFRAQVAAAAGRNALIAWLWPGPMDFYEEARSEELCGPGERARRGQPSVAVLITGAIGALMNRVLQPRPLVVIGLNVWMGTAARADELRARTSS